MLGELGLSDLSVFLIIVAILVGIFLLALLITMSGGHKKFLNGVDRAVSGRAVYDNLPKLKKIADQFPDHPVGRTARACLKDWDNLQPNLEKMSRDRKERKLKSFYHGNMHPILKEYERITKS